MTNAATGKNTQAIQQGDRYTICPKYNCIYTKPLFDTTCGEQANHYNTNLNLIHFTPQDSNYPTKQCVTQEEAIPAQSRVNICKSDPLDTMSTLDTIYPSTLEECKQSCDTNGDCKYVLYGNATCHLMNRNTPMMNIVETGQDTEIHKCTSSLPLKYAGATEQQMSRLPCRVGGVSSSCKYLGSSGCNDSDNTCLAPYQPVKQHTRQKCADAWSGIIQQQSTLFDAQPDYDDSNMFLKDMCSKY